MKIAIVVMDLTISGGTQRQALQLARQLQNRHDVTIFAYAFNKEKCYPELTDNLKIKHLKNTIKSIDTIDFSRFWHVAYKQFHYLDYELQELSNLLTEPFDIINGHDIYTERIMYQYKKRFNSTPTVWMSNDIPPIFQIKERFIQDKPRINGVRHFLLMSVRSLLFWYQELLEKYYIARGIDAVVVLDKRNQFLFNTHLEKSASIIRSGVDLSHFKVKSLECNDVFTILGVGILFPLRRFEDLIDAAHLLKKKGARIKLNIVGSDECDSAYASNLKSKVIELKLEKNVIFLGKVSDATLKTEYQNADVFVFPNHNQTWGLAVFEAMASGTPVIVSKTAGASEVIQDGQNGLLVDPMHPEQIAEKIKLLIDQPALRHQLAVNGRRFVEENLSWGKYANNMEKIFLDVLTERNQ